MVRVTIAAAAVMLAASTLWAQGVTSSGLFGSRTIGGPISGGTRNAFGGSSSMGALGMSGGLSQQANTGQITGSERFLRSNRTAGEFVGSDNADSGFVGALSTGNGGFSSGMSGLSGGRLGGSLGGMGGGMLSGGLGGMGMGARNNQRMGQMGRNGNMNLNMGANRNRAINVRTTLEVGFRYKSLPTSAVRTKLTERLNDARIGRLGDLEVDVQGRVATLRGRVASQDDRDLARRIAKMEPGVETVVDELIVDSSEPDLGSPLDGR